MSTYQHQTYGMGFTFNPGRKVFGKVKLKSGREIFRNYKRELKNGKGYDWADVMTERILASKNKMYEMLANLYSADMGERE